MSRFQMQSWEKGVQGDESRGWEPMENGSAKRVWRPRDTAEEAVRKCIAWTGGIAIPAMQVVDLETGAVVWRDKTDRYPEAGPPITLRGEQRIRRELRDEWEREAAERRAEEAAERERRVQVCGPLVPCPLLDGVQCHSSCADVCRLQVPEQLGLFA